MLRRRRANGFTLIELVVVIAILGILAGIGILRLIDANKEARRNTCLANRTTLSHELSYQEALGVDPATYFASVYSTAENAVNRFRCPSGGTYTLNANTLEVSCSDEDHTESSIGAAEATTGVDVNKLKLSSWSAAVQKAQNINGGLFLNRGTVYTDSTGTYFVYNGTNLSKQYASTNPTLSDALAAGAGVAKINMDSYLTSADQTLQGKKKVWTTVPTLGTVYYDSDSDSYYVYHLDNCDEHTALNVTTSSHWLKISK